MMQLLTPDIKKQTNKKTPKTPVSLRVLDRLHQGMIDVLHDMDFLFWVKLVLCMNFVPSKEYVLCD